MFMSLYTGKEGFSPKMRYKEAKMGQSTMNFVYVQHNIFWRPTFIAQCSEDLLIQGDRSVKNCMFITYIHNWSN